MSKSTALVVILLVNAVIIGTVYFFVLRAPQGGGSLQAVVKAVTPLPEPAVKLSSGSPASSFSLPDLGGNTVSLKDYQGKGPVVLCFWATWCPHCKRALPILHEAAALYKSAGLRVLAIDQQEEKKLVADYIQRHGYSSFVVLLDQENRISVDYGLKSIPQLVFVDEKGNYLDQAPAARFNSVKAYARLFAGYFNLRDRTVQRVVNAASVEGEKGELLTDFRKGLGAWRAYDDGMVRGASEVQALIRDGLRLRFKLKAGRAWSKPYAGIQYKEAKARDLSTYSKLRFTLACSWRAKPERSRVVVEVGFGGKPGSKEFPSALAELELPAELSILELPLAAFKVPVYKREQFEVECPDWTSYRGMSIYVQAAELKGTAEGRIEIKEIRLVK